MLGTWEVPAPIRAQQAIDSHLVLAILANGTYHLFSTLNPLNTPTEGSSHVHLGWWHPATGPASVPKIRDMATAPWRLPRFAVGGAEGMLDIFDLTRCQNVSRTELGAPIGSICWSERQGDHVLSATLDTGVLVIFDIRQPELAAQIRSRVDAHRNGLYAHLQLGHDRVLLGFGDGRLVVRDLRQPHQDLAYGRDPYVSAVGELDGNLLGDRIVASGLADFSVYTHTLEGLTHGFHDPRRQTPSGDPLHVCARFGDVGEVWTVDSTGSVSIFLEDRSDLSPDPILVAAPVDESGFASATAAHVLTPDMEE